MNEEEIILINNEPFYRIPNGTSYDYAPIPKQFKHYFERLQQENQQLKEQKQELKTWLEDQQRRSWDEVSDTFGYVLDKLLELEAEHEQIK